MNSEDNYNDLLISIKTVFEQIIEIEIDELLKRDELGKFSFASSEKLFIYIHKYILSISFSEYEGIPYRLLNNFYSSLLRLKTALINIKNYSPESAMDMTNQNSLIKNLENSFEKLYLSSATILVNNNLVSKSIDNMDEQIHKLQLSQIREKAKSDSDKMLSEIKEILEATRKAASETVVSHHSKIFSEEAKTHNRISNYWLIAVILAILIIFSIGLGLLFFKPAEVENNFYMIQFTITKLVILTGLFYGLSICIKNYKAHRHNQILNKHRQNALSSFEAFAKASGDDTAIKNAILLEVTHTIFSNQQTGYLNNDNDNDSPNKIIEIIKSTTSNHKEV